MATVDSPVTGHWSKHTKIDTLRTTADCTRRRWSGQTPLRWSFTSPKITHCMLITSSPSSFSSSAKLSCGSEEMESGGDPLESRYLYGLSSSIFSTATFTLRSSVSCTHSHLIAFAWLVCTGTSQMVMLIVQCLQTPWHCEITIYTDSRNTLHAIIHLSTHEWMNEKESATG